MQPLRRWGPTSTLLLWELFYMLPAPTRGDPAMRQLGGVVTAAPGTNVTLRCFMRSGVDMHFSWYSQSAGRPPLLLSSVYRFGGAAEGVRPPSRFEVQRGNQDVEFVNHLHIADVRCGDSAVYYCGSSHSNVVKFGDGVFLRVGKVSENQTQQFPNGELAVHDFWCNLHCGAGRNISDDDGDGDGDDDDACPLEDFRGNRSRSADRGRGRGCGNMASQMRVLVLLSIGRIATILLFVVVAALVCYFKSVCTNTAHPCHHGNYTGHEAD